MSRRLWLPVVSGPLAPYAAGYRVWMLERGYKPRSVVNRLELLGQLSRWLEVEALTPVELTPEQVERFLEPRRAAGYSRCVSAQSRSLPLEYLRELGVAPCPAPVELAEGPLERLLLDYRRYLFEERGLCARTVLECYEPTARSFLSGREGSARACREWGPISSGTRRRRGCCGAARRLRRSGRCFATATSARPRVTRRSTARRYGGSRGRGRKAVRHDTAAASA